MFQWTSVVAIAILLLVGCQSESPVKGPIELAGNSENSDAPLESERLESKTMLLSDGTTLRYSVYLPKGFQADKKTYSLIFSLHFGGRVTAFYGGSMISMLVAPGLKELEPIIVAPDSLNGAWNTAENIAAIDQLWQQIQSDYKIDKRRTLLTGFSMGGHGTWAIAAQFPDRFRAAIPIAGRGLSDQEVTGATWQMPVYVIHSKADKVVPIEPTRAFVEQMTSAGADVTFVEVEELPHFQTYRFADPLKEAIPWIREVWSR